MALPGGFLNKLCTTGWKKIPVFVSGLSLHVNIECIKVTQNLSISTPFVVSAARTAAVYIFLVSVVPAPAMSCVFSPSLVVQRDQLDLRPKPPCTSVYPTTSVPSSSFGGFVASCRDGFSVSFGSQRCYAVPWSWFGCCILFALLRYLRVKSLLNLFVFAMFSLSLSL